MLFTSVPFALFLTALFVAYWTIPSRWISLRNVLLVLASYVFYVQFKWQFALILLAITLADYAVALQMSRISDRIERKKWLYISFAINLGALIYFKYTGFFFDSIEPILRLIHWSQPVWITKIILPVGLSYIVLRSLTYTIGVYRDELPAEKRLLNYALFVAFFPQITAGPIERARNFLPQIAKLKVFDDAQMRDALRRILYGLMKKVVIADNLAVIINPTFDNPGSGVVWLVTLLYPIQLYCDFSGYTDIAIGVSSLFGFRSAPNFATPFFSRNIAEFWRKWHISLTTWLFEYIYNPIAGLSPTPRKRAWVILLVFLVSGLWHGAGMTFILWGLLHGLYYLPLALKAQTQPVAKHVPSVRFGLPSRTDALKMKGTYLLIAFSFIFFRAEDMRAALNFLAHLFHPERWLPNGAELLWTSAAMLLIGWEWVWRKKKHLLDVSRYPLAVRWAIYVGLILLYLLFGKFDSGNFVYVQF